MFMSPKSAFNRCEAIVTGMFSVPSKAGALAVGLADATYVSTPGGPRAADTLAEGTCVLARDGAAYPIQRVMRRTYGADITGVYPQGLVLVPRGTLGAQNDLYLLPDQPIGLIGPGCCTAGAPMIRARALAGHGPVQFAVPVDGLTVTRLLFADTVEIAVGGGLSLGCPAARSRPMVMADATAQRHVARAIPSGHPFPSDHALAVPAHAA